MPKRQLKRSYYEIVKHDNHNFELKHGKPKGFVASGAGAKGIAYAGIIQAMFKAGVIKDLTHVCGASAGAMIVSLIAFGMPHEKITKLISNLNILNILDKTGTLKIRAKGERLSNLLEIIYIQQINEHIKGITKPTTKPASEYYERIEQKINVHNEVLKKCGIEIKSFDALIEFINSDKLKTTDNEFYIGYQQKVSARISFSDLENLRSLLPKEKQHYIKNLSVVTTNQSRKKLECFNARESGNESISVKVQQSGAHPLLFTPAKNELGESIADGGILDNMPSEVLEKEFKLGSEEILCAKIESESLINARVQKAKSPIPETQSFSGRFVDSITNVLLGGNVYKGRTEVLNREKVFYDLGNMFYVSSGKISTTSTSLTQKQKDDAITDAFQQTGVLLKNQIRTFDNALLPMLYLGSKQLDNTLIVEDNKSEFFLRACQAKIIFKLQESFLAGQFKSLPYYMSQFVSILNLQNPELEGFKLNPTQQEQALSLILKQINFLSEGKLEHYLLAQIKTQQEGSKVSIFTEVLNLLYKPLEWIFTKLRTINAGQTDKSSVEQAPQIETNPKKDVMQEEEVYSARRVYSMFSKSEVHSNKHTKEPEVTSSSEVIESKNTLK